MERYSDLCNDNDFFDEEEFKEWCRNFELTVGEPMGPWDEEFLSDLPFGL